MSAPDSDKDLEADALVEDEARETWMPFGHGKVPKYVAAVWIVFLVGFLTYMVKYLLPDLQSWGMP